MVALGLGLGCAMSLDPSLSVNQDGDCELLSRLLIVKRQTTTPLPIFLAVSQASAFNNFRYQATCKGLLRLLSSSQDKITTLHQGYALS